MMDVLIPSISIIVAAAAYVTFMYSYMQRRISERGGGFRKAKELFSQELRRRITLGVIRDLDDITMVKNWAIRQEESSRFEGMAIDELLEEFLSTITRDEEDEGRTKQEYLFVESLIDTKRRQEPFSILPEGEKTKAQRLQRSIETGEKEEAMSQFQELVNSLGGRIQGLNKVATRNRNLAIVATIASISAIPIAIIF